MKTLVLRRGILTAIVGLLLVLCMFLFNESDESSEILSDSSRRLPKSQNPNVDVDNFVHMDRPNGPKDDFDRLNGLESQIGALQGNMEKISTLNRDNTQGWCIPIFYLLHFTKKFSSRQVT